MSYDSIKALKRTTRRKIPDLLALSCQNDPFFAGSKTNKKNAKWFAQMWNAEYQGQTGIHVRRVHYFLQAKGYPKPNGMHYQNTARDWRYLLEASRCARLLGLVPANAFEDHRNEEPHALSWSGDADDGDEPHVVKPSPGDWSLPALDLNLSTRQWRIETADVIGYRANDYLDRFYYLEVWCEKSTMDDILVPLTKQLGVRLVPSTGYQSISNIIRLLERVRKIEKATRVFYISDADPARINMPIAVARQIEFWIPTYAPGADIKLTALVLTKEQIAKHKLPKNEKGAVELDALEALVPGELSRIVRQAVDPYLDETIGTKLREAKTEASRIITDEWSRLSAPYKKRLRDLERRANIVAKQYQKETAALAKRLRLHLAPLEKPLAQLRAAVEREADRFDPDLPERPCQDPGDLEEDGFLFDSARAYMEQLAVYKKNR